MYASASTWLLVTVTSMYTHKICPTQGHLLACPNTSNLCFNLIQIYVTTSYRTFNTGIKCTLQCCYIVIWHETLSEM